MIAEYRPQDYIYRTVWGGSIEFDAQVQAAIDDGYEFFEGSNLAIASTPDGLMSSVILRKAPEYEYSKYYQAAQALGFCGNYYQFIDQLSFKLDCKVCDQIRLFQKEHPGEEFTLSDELKPDEDMRKALNSFLDEVLEELVGDRAANFKFWFLWKG